MKIDHGDYDVYNNSRIIHGTNIEIDYSVYYKRDCDISDLIQMSAKDVERFRNKSIASENKAYEKENESCPVKFTKCFSAECNHNHQSRR